MNGIKDNAKHINMNDFDQPIDLKFRELNINHYSMPDPQFQNLKAFNDEFRLDEKYEEYKDEIAYLTADALANRKDHQGALKAFSDLYEFGNYQIKSLVAQRMAEQLKNLGREDEAFVIVENVMANESYAQHQLDILFWAVTNLSNPDVRLQQFRDKPGQIAERLGIDISGELPGVFSNEIVSIKKEWHSANRRFSEVMLNLKDLSDEEKTVALKHYIAHETVGEYIKMAESFLHKL